VSFCVAASYPAKATLLERMGSHAAAGAADGSELARHELRDLRDLRWRVVHLRRE